MTIEQIYTCDRCKGRMEVSYKKPKYTLIFDKPKLKAKGKGPFGNDLCYACAMSLGHWFENPEPEITDENEKPKEDARWVYDLITSSRKKK